MGHTGRQKGSPLHCLPPAKAPLQDPDLALAPWGHPGVLQPFGWVLELLSPWWGPMGLQVVLPLNQGPPQAAPQPKMKKELAQMDPIYYQAAAEQRKPPQPRGRSSRELLGHGRAQGRGDSPERTQCVPPQQHNEGRGLTLQSQVLSPTGRGRNHPGSETVRGILPQEKKQPTFPLLPTGCR